MAWGAAIGGIISGLGSAAGGFFGGGADSAEEVARQLKHGGRTLRRSLDRLRAGTYGFPTEEIFGTRPEFAEFNPIDLTDEQLARIAGNAASLPSISENVFDTNLINTLAGQIRFDQLVPRGRQALSGLGRTSETLLRGELPFDDVLDVVRNRAGLAQTLGINGTQLGGALPRDLGLSRLQAIQTGGNLLAQATALADQVDPVARQLAPQSFYLSPELGAQVGLNQAILGQQSRQGANLFASAPDPVSSGIFNFDLMTQLARMGQAAAIAAAQPSTSIDYQLVGQGISQVGAGLSQLFQGNGNNNGSNTTGAPSATPAFNPISSIGNAFGSVATGFGNAVSGAARGIGSLFGGLF